MHTLRHILNTWFTSLLIYPFYILFFTMRIPSEIYEFFTYLYFFGFVFSIPALLLSWLCLKAIASRKSDLKSRYHIWLITLGTCVIVESCLVFDLFGMNINEFQVRVFCGSAVCSAVTMAIIRRSQFIRLCQSYQHEPEQ
jgi:hypothetical protein